MNKHIMKMSSSLKSFMEDSSPAAGEESGKSRPAKNNFEFNGSSVQLNVFISNKTKYF